jgi:hypothetical protein
MAAFFPTAVVANGSYVVHVSQSNKTSSVIFIKQQSMKNTTTKRPPNLVVFLFIQEVNSSN